MLNLNVSEFIIRAVAIIIGFTIHEYSHALVSTVQGDDTPRLYGRLTLNPAAHIDVAGLIALFIFRFGWAKPVPISSQKYRHPRLGVVLTSLAGPASNLILAFFTAVIFAKVNVTSPFTADFLSELFGINIGLAVFNLIPVPPLDGSAIITETVGGRVAEFMYSMERKGSIIVFLLLWLPPVQSALFYVMNTVANAINTLALMI